MVYFFGKSFIIKMFVCYNERNNCNEWERMRKAVQILFHIYYLPVGFSNIILTL